MTVDQSTLIEEWRDIQGWESSYQVSSFGRVRSKDIDRLDKLGRRWSKKGTIHGQHLKPNGYVYVNLKSSPRMQRRYVHQLVLETFVGPRPDGAEACHNDGERTNNHLENLRWDTVSENRLDIKRMGRHNEGSKTHCDNGHLFDESNTILYGPNGDWRRCRACRESRYKSSA